MILDLFVSVFEADTKNFEMGAKKVEKSTDEIIENLKSTEKKSKGIFDSLGKAMEVAYDSTDIVNMNSKNMNSFFDIIKKHGVTAEDTSKQLKDLFFSVEDAISNVNSEQAKVFDDLNISLKNTDGSVKDIIVLIDELADSTKNVSDERVNDIFTKLGLEDAKIIDAIKRSKSEISGLSKEIRKVKSESEIAADKFKNFIKGAVSFLGTVAVAGKGVGIAISQADKIKNLEDTADAIATTSSNLKGFNVLMAESDIEAEKSTEALKGLFESTGEAINNVNSEQAKIFKQLGISLNNADGSIKDTTSLMGDLAEALSNTDKRQAQNVFKKLGITDPKTANEIIKQGKSLKETVKQYSNLYGITEKQSKIAKEYRKSQDRLNNTLENAKNSIMQYIAPAITWLIDKFTIVIDWMNKHQAFVIGFFGAIAVVVSTLYLPAMIKAGIATLAATWPILLIATAIGIAATAIALLVDDIYTWIEGGDSLIGQLISFEDAMNLVNSAIDFLVDGFNGGIEAIKNFGSAFIDMVVGVKNDVVANFNAIKDFINGLLDTVFGTINKIKDAFKGVKSFFGFGDGDANLELANKTITDIQANPLNKVSSQQISNMSNSKNEQNIGIGEITINTQATNSKEISSDIKSDLENQLQNLKAESYSGIDI